MPPYTSESRQRPKTKDTVIVEPLVLRSVVYIYVADSKISNNGCISALPKPIVTNSMTGESRT